MDLDAAALVAIVAAIVLIVKMDRANYARHERTWKAIADVHRNVHDVWTSTLQLQRQIDRDSNVPADPARKD